MLQEDLNQRVLEIAALPEVYPGLGLVGEAKEKLDAINNKIIRTKEVLTNDMQILSGRLSGMSNAGEEI